MRAFAERLEATPLSHALQQAIWLIELLQIIHILSVAIVLSSVVMVGLRIAGVNRALDQSLLNTARRFMPWFWTGFFLLACSGIVLIIGEPKRTLDGNPAFLAKMILIVVALAAALIFNVSVTRNAASWNETARHKILRRILVAAGFALFCTIVVAGRLIAYLSSQGID
jgi:putative copper export protein